MDKDYIERGALIAKLQEIANRKGIGAAIAGIIIRLIETIPAADVEEVKHGRWVLEAHSFYRDTFDECCELVIYITASCSECGEKHPNRYEVFSKTLYAPEDAGDDFRFDQKAEREKAMAEFMQRRNVFFANHCPNCGAKMDGEA